MSDLMERFKKGEVAVNCRTEEAAREFLKECDNAGLAWTDGTKLSSKTLWEYNDEVTCYKFDDGVSFCDKSWFEMHNVEIIEYKGECKLTTLQMMEKLMENPKLESKSKSLNMQVYYDETVGVFRGSSNHYPIGLKMNVEDWEIIYPGPKKVTFLEAIKELKEGKRVYSLLNGKKRYYKGTVLRDHNEAVLNTAEILDAEWYVEAQHE